ncbi:MAG TPA: DUF6159 family protein [Casimicrobiaceae bacterium]|nr:DUF6159 family protein [Casimicrobiaceae bacterium]
MACASSPTAWTTSSRASAATRSCFFSICFSISRWSSSTPRWSISSSRAFACAPQIAMWAAVSSTVGLVLQFLRDRSGILGRIAASLAGVAWTLITYFVVPMIVIERKGALEALSDSKDLFVNTWGKEVAGELSYGVVGFLLSIPGVAVAFGSCMLLGYGRFQNWAAVGPFLVGSVLYLIALSIVMSALKAIFGVVLYLYARTGKIPSGFDADMLDSAVHRA